MSARMPFDEFEPGQDDLLDMFGRLVKIRACDEAIREAIKTGRVPAFYFPVTGQEAIAAALHQVKKETDYMVTYYRGLHHHLAGGLTIEQVFGEMCGKATGSAGGKGGQMHLVRPESGLMMTTGIVAGGIPPAVGLALTSKMRKDNRVTVVNFGDGAVQNGYFHEAANMAARWDLPLVLLCENNKFAETVPTDIGYKGHLSDRAKAYSMNVEDVDGYDPIALYSTFSRAFDRARSGFGPTFINAECFRFCGHFFGEPMPAVPRDVLNAELKKDPCITYRAKLISEFGFDEAQLDSIKADADVAAERAIASTIDAPVPEAENAYSSAYSNPIEVR